MLEELDYRREAANQRLLAAYYDGHPTIHVPAIIDELSTRRVVTSELSDGARFAELENWSQEERDLAGETIYRFVFRSLYELHAFNGDPHPGNYLFHGGGRVTFLDFGLVKYFTAEDLRPLMDMVRTLCVSDEPEEFRRGLEEAGFLRRGAPLSTDDIVDDLALFYELVRESQVTTVTGDYAPAVVRRFFDVRRPVAQYASIPRSYVILQRINLGLFALLGDLQATANWRAIAEEIWPFTRSPPSTPMGEAEAKWRASRPAGLAGAASPSFRVARCPPLMPSAGRPLECQQTRGDRQIRWRMPMDVRSYIDQNAADFFAALQDWLRIPSISADPARHADVRRSAQWLADQLPGPGLPGSRGVGDGRARAGRHGLGPARRVRALARGRPGRAGGAGLRAP